MTAPSSAVATPIALPTGEPGPRVDAPCGSVRGVWRDVSHTGRRARFTRSAAFYGIPYARAPVGRRRLMAPVRAETWSGELDATVPGPTPQRESIFEDPAIPEPTMLGQGILNLNVFTPTPGRDAGLPVYVWIHGGAWVSGSHNSPWYDGAAFNRDGVVTVSVAYRLGFEGYGWVEGSDAPYNRGVLDQVMALEWVRDNIADFGGDPSRVTVGGQSAGGGNAMILLGVPRATGLLHGVISESGAVPRRDAATAQRYSHDLAAAIGVEASLEGLRSVPYEEVFTATFRLDAQSPLPDDDGAGAAGPDPVAAARRAIMGVPTAPAFVPVVDGEVIPEPIEQALAAGAGGDTPVLAGSTTHEFTVAGLAYEEVMAGRDARQVLVEAGMGPELAERYAAAHPEHADAPHLLLGDLISDSTFHMPLVDWLEQRARAAAAGEPGTAGGVDATDEPDGPSAADEPGGAGAAGRADEPGGAGAAGRADAADEPGGAGAAGAAGVAGRAARSWAYEFTRPGPLGMATHCMELPFAFDCLAHPFCERTLGEARPGDEALAEAMHADWVRFITTGDPGWEDWGQRGLGRRYGSAAQSVGPAGAAGAAKTGTAGPGSGAIRAQAREQEEAAMIEDLPVFTVEREILHLGQGMDVMDVPMRSGRGFASSDGGWHRGD